MTRSAFAATLVFLVAVSACSSAPAHHQSQAGPPTTGVPSTPSSSAPGSTAAAPSTTAACTNASVIASWPTERKAAELVVVPSLNFDLSGFQSLIAEGIGGILFLGNAPAPADLGHQLAALESAAPTGGAPLVMADEEGGGIQRLTGLVSSFPWPRTIAATMTPAQTRALGATVGSQMKRAGVDVDLAPVVDVDGGNGPSRTDVDGFRSFSDNPSTAAEYSVAFLQGLRQSGVIPVIKHFPGLGGSYGDTDYAPAATLPLSELRTRGLVPFQAAIAAGAPAVMISNATVPGVTSLPASLSAAVIQGLLRQQLGFTGLVITDSLSAGAVTAAGYTIPKAAAAAISAGADQILFGATLTPHETSLLDPAALQQTTDQIIEAIVDANRSGALSSAAFNEAVGQVIKAKGVNLCG